MIAQSDRGLREFADVVRNQTILFTDRDECTGAEIRLPGGWQVEADFIDAIMEDISKDHMNFNCKDKVRRAWLNRGVTIVHNYNVDRLGNYTATITVDDCGFRSLI